MVQDTTIQIKGFWSFLNSNRLSINKKIHFGHGFAFDVPIVWNDLPDESPNSCLFQKKVEIISLQKGFPNLAYTLSGVSVVLDFA